MAVNVPRYDRCVRDDLYRRGEDSGYADWIGELADHCQALTPKDGWTPTSTARVIAGLASAVAYWYEGELQATGGAGVADAADVVRENVRAVVRDASQGGWAAPLLDGWLDSG